MTESNQWSGHPEAVSTVWENLPMYPVSGWVQVRMAGWSHWADPREVRMEPRRALGAASDDMDTPDVSVTPPPVQGQSEGGAGVEASE